MRLKTLINKKKIQQIMETLITCRPINKHVPSANVYTDTMRNTGLFIDKFVSVKIKGKSIQVY